MAGPTKGRRPSPLIDRKDSLALLTIRTYEAKDEEYVKSLLFAHARSQIWPAVKFFTFRNMQEWLILFVLFKLYVSFVELLIIFGLFVIWLFIRAKWEFESYIYTSCHDLDDIDNIYLKETGSHFWVAEVPLPSAASHLKSKPSQHGHSEDEDRMIVGCIAVTPSVEEPRRVAQVMRLVVAQQSRRMRVGTSMLKELEAFCLKGGFEEIRFWANNLRPEAIRFYESNGYEILSIHQRNLMRGDLVLLRRLLAGTKSDLSPSLRHADSTF
ncbi:unnamed protein product [Vitrella brassicaformis CCMP3155]|uniref:N-acetyltransferase domain-containing protein n=1 Tax=Vitrella brassicaformis (strain CCMP3155) TaxID=1169540 RepID=A0A0G4G9Q6_VITBC|nr:unnamed protein product [Vitrella brassicaformis CCMP3155]|eukprot:CEM25436.1 unnamed protein product [Vitrella brassicaformis CCMP3155]